MISNILINMLKRIVLFLSAYFIITFMACIGVFLFAVCIIATPLILVVNNDTIEKYIKYKEED